ncbi:MAG: Stk1 family PASTA domain-containing Ser/Thr kinase [Ruminococcus sp.]|jgi:serine/threonine-protein kinase|nr:Stk1 family PASTA domain-containing Ser/Thr kinase [Ruminococcus sp.]
MDKNIGKRLDGRYEITELIGVGGMADVYKATDILEGKVVAVKILKPEFSDNEEFIRRFRNESKAIAVLSHPNIVKIFDVGFTDKLQFIVMEYIDGITLKEFIEQQGVLKWKDSIHFIIQILRALQHAHDRGIVHRDIKPQNIMLFPDGTIKVMDFGIARFAREELKTISDKAIGSVHYISPEQASGNVTDERSDIYSVGIMMYEMLTGIKPFDADNPVTVVLMHMQKGARPPRQINDTIPEGLEEIVIRAMQADPSKRYQSASEMIKDIEEFKRNPAIIFAYEYASKEQTQNFSPAVKESASRAFENTLDRNSVSADSDRDITSRKKNEEKQGSKVRTKTRDELKRLEYDDDDDEDGDVSKSSYFVAILTAIAAGIVILVVAFVVIQLIDITKGSGEAELLEMTDLIGLSYQDVKVAYADKFELRNAGEEYNDMWPAGAIIRQSIEAGDNYKKGVAIQEVTVSKGKRQVIIDNVYGQEAEAATAILMANGNFIVRQVFQSDENVEEGMVIKTDPPRNEKVDSGSLIYMYVSNGSAQPPIYVPNVVGQTEEQARILLEKLAVTVLPVDSKDAAGTVVEQSVPPLAPDGTPNIIRVNDPITIKVSTGNSPETTVSISFIVPSGINKSASATFRTYINGNLKLSTDIDNIRYTETVSVPVSGTGTQRVIVEGVNNDTRKLISIGEYEVNFDTGTVTEVEFKTRNFLTLFEAEEQTTTTTAFTYPDPWANDDTIIDGDEFWNNIIGE